MKKTFLLHIHLCRSLNRTPLCQSQSSKMCQSFL
nr:MAG TPA: hypothetical protein [Bacteriophage sp.]